MTKQNKNLKKNEPQAAKISATKTPSKTKTPPSVSDGSENEKWGKYAIWGLFALTILVFSPIFSNEFVNWDDDVNLEKNDLLKVFSFENTIAIFKQTIIGNYNPLPIFTFAIERALFGDENWSFVVHLNNLLLHLGCVYFVHRLASEMGVARITSLIIAALFALHPMRVESVAWATERKDVLYAIFFFASLLQYVKYLKSNDYRISNRHLTWAFLLFIPALLSKVQAVSLPLSMLALDYYFRRPLSMPLIFEKTHFWLGALAIGLVNVFSLMSFKSIGGASVNYSTFDRFCVAAYAHGVYILKCIFPYRMSPLYPYEENVPLEYRISAVVFLLTLGFLYWAWRQGWRTLIFGWLFFFVNFVFVSQFLGAGQGLIADRFTYVAYFGFFFILAESLQQSKVSPNLIKLSVGIYLAILSFITFNQNKIWQNSELLWTHVLKYYDKTAVPYGNRGTYFREKGMSDRAMTDFSTSLSLKPSADTYNSRGKLFFDNGKTPLALADYNAALKLDTSKAEFYANRAAAFGSLNRLDSAASDLDNALRLDSTNINARVNRGTLFLAEKKLTSALSDFNYVISKDPKHKNAHLNRFLVHKQLGNNDLAFADADVYLTLNPKSWQFFFERALLKKQLGRFQEALADLAQVQSLNANLPQVHVHRAQCFQKLNNMVEAEKEATLARQKGVAFQMTQ